MKLSSLQCVDNALPSATFRGSPVPLRVAGLSAARQFVAAGEGTAIFEVGASLVQRHEIAAQDGVRCADYCDAPSA